MSRSALALDPPLVLCCDNASLSSCWEFTLWQPDFSNKKAFQWDAYHPACWPYPSMHCGWGCTCPGVVRAWGVYLPRGVYLPGGVPAQVLAPPPWTEWLTDRCKTVSQHALRLGVYLPRGGTCPGGVPAQGGVPARGVPAQVLAPSPVNRMTDRQV